MAQTIDQWYDKIKGFVPGWVFEKEVYSRGVYRAIAAVFSQIQTDCDDAFNATFLTRSTTPILDMEGDERGVDRLSGETNAQYVARIQRITSQTDEANILAAINALLLIPGAKIQRAPQDSPYCSRGAFCSRDNYLSAPIRNFFTVVVPMQVHAPYSFASRAYFASRGNFAGSSTGASFDFTPVITTINSMKALGNMYRIVVTNHPVVV